MSRVSAVALLAGMAVLNGHAIAQPSTAKTFILKLPCVSSRYCRVNVDASIDLIVGGASARIIRVQTPTVIPHERWKVGVTGYFGREQGEPILGVSDPAHNKYVELLKHVITLSTDSDTGVHVGDDEETIIFLGNQHGGKLADRYGLTEGRIVKGGNTLTCTYIRMGDASVTELASRASFLLGTEPMVYAFDIDSDNRTESYVLGNKLFIRAIGAGTPFTELRFRPDNEISQKVKHLPVKKPVELSLFVEPLPAEDLAALKALCTLPRREVLKVWFQHPRMYCLEL